MVTASLANILLDVGVNVKYPHNVETPTRTHVTRERAKQIESMRVQSVDDYKQQVRNNILALLED